VVRAHALAKTLTVIEAGTGFAFLAAVIGYFPVILSGVLAARGGHLAARCPGRLSASASSCVAAPRRPGHGGAHRPCCATGALGGRRAREHLSYPPLGFRSQHYNESWLAALTTILDASAVVMIGLEGWCARQAELTFAMARHAVVDLAQVSARPRAGASSACSL